MHPAFYSTVLFLLFSSGPVTAVTKSPPISAFPRWKSLNQPISLYSGTLPYRAILLSIPPSPAMPSLAPKGQTWPVDQAGCTDHPRCGSYLGLFSDLTTFTSWLPFPPVLPFLLPSDSLLSTVRNLSSDLKPLPERKQVSTVWSELLGGTYQHTGSADCRLVAMSAAAGRHWVLWKVPLLPSKVLKSCR